MIDSLNDIASELRTGTLLEHRHENLELKESWRDDNGPKLSALANRFVQEPAWLVIGVTNDGRVAGRDEKWARSTEEVVSQHLNRYLDPTQACTRISALEIDGSWILVVAVRNPGAVVYWEGRAYKRAGTTIEEMKPGEVLELTISLPGLSDYSKQPWTGRKDAAKVARFLRDVMARGREFAVRSADLEETEEQLSRLGIGTSNASRILFGDCAYRFACYDSDGQPVVNERRQGLFDLVSGSLLEEIQEWAREQLGQVDAPFPPLAVKEALANAVAHAAYFEQDGDVTIEVYPDRVVLSNLCLPDAGYFANRWFSRSRRTVNGLLMESLRVAGKVDELGRGKNLIFRDSILNGKKPPQVTVERAGRYDRWRLVVHGGSRDLVQLRLLKRLQDMYADQHKALIAHALVVWRTLPLAEIRNYIDGESLPIFAEVLGDLNGPIFFWQERDRIVLRRWARVLLDEGKDSKSLTPAEEMDLYEFAYDVRTKYWRGTFSPAELRKLAAMGETPSERTATSRLLKRWKAEGKIRKLRGGRYEFVPKPAPAVDFKKLLEALRAPEPER